MADDNDPLAGFDPDAVLRPDPETENLRHIAADLLEIHAANALAGYPGNRRRAAAAGTRGTGQGH
jgi:hypothetical protein